MGPAALAPGDARPLRSPLAWLAFAYTVFAVAGSLVPYRWVPVPLELAWPLYLERLSSLSGPLSRVDVGVNVLLFIPLAYLWCGAVAAGRSRAWAWVLLPLWPLLAAGIEFAQLAFPPRVSSLSDVLAESCGGLIGTLLWTATGAAFCRGALSWARARHRGGRWPILLYAYVIALFAYSLLPLDLSLSPADFYAKWQAGHIVLVPFGFHYASAGLAWMDRALDTAMWVPVGLLATLARRGTLRQTLIFCAAAALLLQVLKLPVLSRVSDLTDILFAALGGAIGVLLGRMAGWADAAPPAPSTAGPTRRQGLLLAALLVYSVLLPAMFWFPYEFRLDPAFVSARVQAWSAAPLAVLFGAEELGAAGAIVRKWLAFAPLGALLALLLASLPGSWRRAGGLVAALWALGLIALVQAGQLLVPERYPDFTGAVLMALGSACGAVAVAGWPRRGRRSLATAESGGRAGVRAWLAGWVALSLGIWLLTQMPGVPYNLPGLLRPQWPWLSAVLIGAALAIGAAWPGLARRVATGQAPPVLLWRWPLLLIVVAGAVALALMLGAEPIKVTKLVGTTRLDWPEHSEAWARLSVLAGTMLWMLLGGSLPAWARLAGGPARRSLVAVWLALSCLLLPLAYWVIVIEAVTDNLVELIADQASPLAALGLAGWFALMGLAAAMVAAGLRRSGFRPRLLAAAVALVSVGLGWLWLQWVTEAALFKYGNQFSALQFLLSANRQNYLPAGPLFLRYALVHIALLVYLTWAMGPVVRPAVARAARAVGRGRDQGNLRPGR